jgi:integrase
MSSLATPYKHPKSGIYYLRIGVPIALRPVLKKTIIKKSLRTTDFLLAKQRFAIAYAEALSILNSSAVHVLTSNDLQEITHEWFIRQVTKYEEIPSKEPVILTHLLKESGCTLYELKSSLQSSLESGYESQVIYLSKTAQSLIDKLSLGVYRGSDSYKQLIEKLSWRTLDLISFALRDKVDQETVVFPTSNHVLSKVINSGVKVSFKPLGDVVKDYIKHKQLSKEWQSTTEKDVLNIYALFLDELGESTDPNSITREQFRGFLELLSKLPAYYTNTRRFEKYPLNKVIKIADEEGLPRITPSTVRKKFSFVKALVKFSVQEEWIDKDRTKGVQIKTEGTVAIRKPYTKEEIKIIMDATRHKKRPSDFWLPRIGLTTGMRANEILQLLVKDIRCHEGIWYFDINVDIDPSIGIHKKLKTLNSIRKVPIPDVLIKLGFLDFVSSIGEGRLFSCVTRSHDGRYSYIYSKRFNWMISRLGLKPDASVNQLKDFHSFRHTFRASCREFGVPSEEVNLIGGWKSSLDLTTGDRYGKDFKFFLTRLKVSIDLVIIF